MEYSLSILIPARSEMFLANTVQDILKNKRGNTEIIIGLDGEWSDPVIIDHPDVTILHTGKSIGQRAITNRCAEISKAKYVMKCDAHVAFDEGFDVKMMDKMQDDYTMIPVMRNLHAFDWVCEEGHRRYQGNSGVCEVCGKETHREIVWIAKTNPQSTAYYFDKDLHFQYHNEYKKQQSGDIVETMSAQGSCFMLTRQKYFELNICDENFGSWGQQGTEIAIKTWLSGGRLVVNKNTWYAHLFRTKGGDFGFPYPLSGKDVDKARQYSKDLFLNDKWDKAVRPLSWLINKFNPPTWTQPSKSIIYYTDNALDPVIASACQKQLLKASNGLDIVSVSLKPMDFGRNFVLPLERGYLTMFRQILKGLEESKADIIYFCEHDIKYGEHYFDFTPPRKDVYYYNQNVYHLDAKTGQSVFYYAKRTSQLCAYRELLIEHYRKRVAIVEQSGYNHNMGYEPGSHHRAERVDDFGSDVWMSKVPSIDIKHGKNLTQARWDTSQFRDKKSCQGWEMVSEIPMWGKAIDITSEFLRQVSL
jgi:hypothetical protein